jgi:hypothetical protein
MITVAKIEYLDRGCHFDPIRAHLFDSKGNPINLDGNGEILINAWDLLIVLSNQMPDQPPNPEHKFSIYKSGPNRDEFITRYAFENKGIDVPPPIFINIRRDLQFVPCRGGSPSGTGFSLSEYDPKAPCFRGNVFGRLRSEFDHPKEITSNTAPVTNNSKPPSPSVQSVFTQRKRTRSLLFAMGGIVMAVGIICYWSNSCPQSLA